MRPQIATATLIGLLALAATPIRAQEAAAPVWEAVCSVRAGPSRITFRSPSGDVTQDDMAVDVVWSDGTVTDVPLRPAWFKAIKIISNDQSTCSGIGAFEINNGRTLLWLVYDRRPRGDHVALVLVDVRQRSVVDVVDDLGEVRWTHEPMILRRSSGFEVLMIREWLWDPGAGAEFHVPDWMAVVVAHDRITARWRE